MICVFICVNPRDLRETKIHKYFPQIFADLGSTHRRFRVPFTLDDGAVLVEKRGKEILSHSNIIKNYYLLCISKYFPY
jgi:hypothetical protein